MMADKALSVAICPQADDIYTPPLVEALLKTADVVIVQAYWGDLGRYSRFGKRVLIDVRPKGPFGLLVASGRWKGWRINQIAAAEALDAGLGLYPYSVEQPKKREPVSE